MASVTIRPCTYQDIEQAPNVGELWAEYSQESGVPELGAPNPQSDLYRTLEATGALHFLGAFKGDDLVGLIGVLVSVVPHFGTRIATSETFFVRGIDRNSGAGLKLLRDAERLAVSLGAVGIFISAPIGGQLDEVLEASKPYRPTNRVHFRPLA